MFAATRADALARLAAFLPRAGRAYAACRNLDEGPGLRTHVSELSPAIRRRLLTEEEVAKAAVAAHGLEAAEKFVAEVCWRSYWRGVLEMRPALWQRYLDDLCRLEGELARNARLAARFAQAVQGKTGIDCFDFWIRELDATGYLHNHARMSFASIWIFTLRLPWQLGAAHFFRHLLDACPASNTLSWRWVAGLQTPGKTYLARAEIIRKTSLGRFRVEAPLATTAPP
ncbi:FAD-binding domain-containing protein, partial [Thermaurantiacus sp.]